MEKKDVTIMFADESHCEYSEHICKLIYESALVRGTGIAKRSPEYIASKIKRGNAVVAMHGDRLVGFSYIECWGHGDYVATSGLIVDPEYRHLGLATDIKKKTFELTRRKFPYAKIFSITTSLPVMKMNCKLGYVPVTFSELTDDKEFWDGCMGCCNYDILERNQRKMCLCTGMLYDPHMKITDELKPHHPAIPYFMKSKSMLKRIMLWKRTK